MIPPLFGKQEVGIWRVKKFFPRYGVPIWSLWPNIRFLPSIVAEKNATKNGHISRLVIGTSRTVGSAKKFVRIISGFGGGEFTKTLRKVCTCQKLKFSFLETCLVYSCIWSVTLAKSIVPRKTWRKLWHSCISKLFLTKMQVKFSICFHHGSLNVIGDNFRFVRSKLKSR